MNTVMDIAIKVGTGALGGASASLFLASWIAQRQEVGKARAASLLELRALAAEQLAYNDYHHIRAKTMKATVGYPLSPEHGARVACNAVSAARGLTRRKQRHVRDALVRIFGEATVRCAELLALTPFDKGHAILDRETWAAAQLKVGFSLDPGQELRGSFETFSKDPADDDAHARIAADMQRLQAAAGGGTPRLGARTKKR